MSRKPLKYVEDDLMSAEPNEGRLRLELRKLTNSEGWVSATRESSESSSRASTPLSHHVAARRGRPPKKFKSTKFNGTSKSAQGRGRPRNPDKPKQFKMVLEKDEVYEVDYISPDDDVESSYSSTKGADSMDSFSENDDYLHTEDNGDISSEDDPLVSSWQDEELMDEEIPPLELPQSSDDLMIPNNLVLRALSVYEVLRHFRNCLRLSPFLFEDFCAALVCEETTVLINECHITLLKALLKEEDHNNATFVPIDQKDAFNASLYFIDYLTWPEVLRAYLESSPEFVKILPIVEAKEFPYTDVSKKLEVLELLVDMFLASTKIRDELMMDGTIRYDDHCRVCHRLGDLLCCETCSAVYHLACCDPPLAEVPDDEWQCEVCVTHKLNGVTNCEPEVEIAGQYLRHDCIGVDRHGRKYWFLVRRLVVESEDDLRYYSTFEEFKYVVSKLDPEKYEMVLCEALIDVTKQFPQQAHITRELTDEAKWEGGNTCLELLIERTKVALEEEKKKQIEKAKCENKERTQSEHEEKAEVKQESQKCVEVKQEEENRNCKKETVSLDKKDTGGSENITEGDGLVIDEGSGEETKGDAIPNNQEHASSINSEEKVTNSDTPLPKPLVNDVTLEEQKQSTEQVKTQEVNNETPTAVIKKENSISSINQTAVTNETSSVTTMVSTAVRSVAGTELPSNAVKVTPSVVPNTTTVASLPKTTLVPLNNLRVSLSRVDSPSGTQPVAIGTKPSTIFKVGQKIQIKPGTAAAPLATLKNLFVLSKNGVRTPLTIGRDGKVMTANTSKVIMLNPLQQPNKSTTSTPSPKLNRELRRLEFSGAGPKMQKIVLQSGSKSTLATATGTEARIVVKPPGINGTALHPPQEPEKVEPRKPFRLGEDGGYKQYKNHFVENTLALNKYQHKEEKDKDRHVGNKFSLNGPVAFEWIGSLYGTRAEIVHTLRSALFRFEQQIPLCLMHSKWDQYRKMWGKMLVQNDSARAFAVVLGILEMAIRDNAKKTVWKESMGQVRMRRLTPGEKEEYEKKKKYLAKVAEDNANCHAVWCKYPLPIRSTMVWKMKGESYRVTGYGGWMWRSSCFRCLNQKSIPKSYTVIKDFKPKVVGSDETDHKKGDVQSINKDEEKMEVDPGASDKSCVEAVDLTKEIETLVDSQDVIDVSKHLLVRTVLYNRRWSSSKLDKLLRWRVLQEKEKMLACKKTDKPQINKSEVKEEEKGTEEKSEAKKVISGDAPVVNDSADKLNNANTSTKVSECDPCLEDCDTSSASETEVPVSDMEVSADNDSNKEVISQPQTVAERVSTEAKISHESPKEKDVETEKVEKLTLMENNNSDSSKVDCTVSTPDLKTTDKQITAVVSSNLNTTDEDTSKNILKANFEDVGFRILNDAKIDCTSTSIASDVQYVLNDLITNVVKEATIILPQLPVHNITSDETISNSDVNKSDGSVNSTTSTTVTATNSISSESVTLENNGKVVETITSEIVTTMVKTTTTTTSLVTSSLSGQSLPSSNTIIDSQVAPLADSSKSENIPPVTTETKKETLSGDSITTHSWDNISKSSILHMDEASGEVTASSSTVRISRRFRAEKRGHLLKQQDSLEMARANTCKRWKLKKSEEERNKAKKPNDIKKPIPWKFSVGIGKKKNIFRLPITNIRYMAARGGLAVHPGGFHRVPKSPALLELFWPYLCVRPTIGTVWRFKIQQASNLGAIAHLLRILWHSIRWDDIVTKPSSDDMVHAVHTDEDIITTELLKRRDIGDTGLRSQYFVRRIVMPTNEYDEEISRSEVYTPSSRSGLRTRGRQMSLRERNKKDMNVNEPKVETLWMPEHEIELWQIRQFDTMLREQQKDVAKNKTEPNPPSSLTSTPVSRTQNANTITPLQKNVKQDTTLEGKKNVTITTALLQQAAALHRSHINEVPGMPKFVSGQQYASLTPAHIRTLTSPQAKFGDRSQSGSLHKITIKSPATSQQPQFVALKPATGITATPTSGGTLIQSAGGPTLFRTATGTQYIVQGNKIMPSRQILVKLNPNPTSASTVSIAPNHPTIRLANPPKSVQPVQQILSSQVLNKQNLTPPTRPRQSQASLTPKSNTSMQVKLSAAQLADLMKLGMGTVVSVSVTMADGKPGRGQLQMIPSGANVVPKQGQQMMQCKVGNDVRRFLLTAVSDGEKTPSTPDNEVSLKTPSLRSRLEQLQLRQQELLKQPGTDIRRLMTDKDPLWGARTQSVDKLQVAEKVVTKKELSDRPRKKYMLTQESREERQRKNVVQQLVKSLLDRVERKEDMDARKRKKEEQLELQKKKKEIIDVAKSQQRLQSRLVHALTRHQEQLKQEISKRKTITEKYLTRTVENELYDDRIKLKRRRTVSHAQSENAVVAAKQSKKPNKNYLTTSSAIKNVLTESNKKSSHVKGSKRTPKESRKRVHSQEAEPSARESTSKRKKMINTSIELHCICQTPYDNRRFYIGCDLCKNWFHGECVGISERRAKAMETWVCKDCAKEQSTPQQELYCLCKTPYDVEQFYIGCDVCQDWFHGACVGVLEEEAAAIENYTCPRCKKEARDASNEGTLSDREITHLTKIVRVLQNHKMAWPFLEPVRESDAPGYYKVVKRPMDLQTVMKRLQCKYYMKLSELVGDVSLIFDNCRQYNGADSTIVRCAEIVETVFVGKIRDLRGRERTK